MYQLSANKTSCVLIDNCESYAENYCLKCKPDYYLKPNGTCISKTNVKLTSNISPSDVYQINNSNDVIQCLFKQSTGYYRCVADTVVSNCAQYSSPGTCSKCVKGYKLANNNTCKPIPISNCATVEGNTCTSCISGYVLHWSKTCDKISSYCGLPKMDWESKYSCAYCKPGSFIDQYN